MPAVAGAPAPRVDPDKLAFAWQKALDAAERALIGARGSIPEAELAHGRRQLALERTRTGVALAALAGEHGISPAPWLSPVRVSPQMLGVPATARACLFDLDGVLTDSGLVHAHAWAEALDGFLLELTHRTGWHFIPFDPRTDYRDYIDGRPRLEGVHAFLASRGIQLPEGRPDDPAEVETAYGLARRKGDALRHALESKRVSPLDGARRYLEASGYAGLGRGVISASTTASLMLRQAALSSLVDVRVDADTMLHEGLRGRPEPDTLVHACRCLGVRPEEVVTFTNSAAGIAAARPLGMSVVGVGDDAERALLLGLGADHVVAALGSMLDRRLTT
ncbi:MAG TPA: HAD-IA family hydrolase [Gaiellaceae bacterium]|nr:HAD-IA family hydrolase [Gaiellaceae bacterium]